MLPTKYFTFDSCLESNQYNPYQFYVSKSVENKETKWFEFYNFEHPQTFYLYMTQIQAQILQLENNKQKNQSKINYLRNQLTFNECLPSFRDRKMYYDIDIPSKDCTFQKAEQIKHDLISSLIIKLEIKDLRKDIYVLTAHREDKFSYHIILPKIVLSVENLNLEVNKETNQKWAKYIRDFHMECIDLMKEENKIFVDKSIYSHFQNFRMLGQIKCGYNNPFVYKTWHYLDNEVHPYIPEIECKDESKRSQLIEMYYFFQSCIGNTENSDIKIIKLKWIDTLFQTKVNNFNSTCNREDPRIVFRRMFPEICRNLNDSQISDNKYNFINNGGYMCPKCERRHDHQNPYVYFKNILGECQIWFNCRRAESMFICNSEEEKIPEDQEVKQTPEENELEPKPEINKFDCCVKKVDENLEQKVQSETKFEYITEPRFDFCYDEKYCLPIYPEKNTIFYLSAGLGKGKTKVLIDFMKKILEQNPFYKILILSPRQIFASSLLNRLNAENLEFECYLDKKIEDYSSCGRFIVQMESLQHVHIDYNIIIMDEIESCLAQFESNETMKCNLRECSKKFEKLIQNAEYVICCDAFLTTKSTNVISKITNKKRYLCKNTSPQPERKAIEYENIESLTMSLFEDLKNNKKIYLVSASREKIEQLEKTLLKNLHGLKYKTYHSHSKEKIKNVNHDWRDTQLIMVSPSVTVGINYDLEDFDILYVYGVSVSCCVRDLFQSSMRVRHLRDNLMKFSVCNSFLSKNKDESLFSLSKIFDEIRQSNEMQNSFYKQYIPEHLPKSETDGNLINDHWINLSDWLLVNKVYHMREMNLSRNLYKKVFYYYLMFCNYEFNIKNIVNIGTDIKLNECQQEKLKYSEIKEISTKQEASEVLKKIQADGKDVNLYLSLIKYNFISTFQVECIQPKKIDEVFDFYANPFTRKKIYNIKNEKYRIEVVDKCDLLRNVFMENSNKIALRTQKIKEINKILNLVDSCDTRIYSQKETKNIIEKIYPNYIELCKIFNIKEQILKDKPKKEKTNVNTQEDIKRKTVKYVLDQIYLKWNGSKIISNSKQRMVKGERSYNHWFEKTLCGYKYEDGNFTIIQLMSNLLKK